MAVKYELPENISPEMGGTIENFDNRMTSVMELLNEASLESLTDFLDIGVGKGQIIKWLAQKGKTCTGIGLELNSYDANLDELNKKYDIKFIECGIENVPVPDNSFDGIIMSHVLEHCHNVGLALVEVKRLLRPGGWLFIFVPPHENLVCAGHIATGWNIGQLMYVLLLNGFDIKNGRFIKYGYNICAFVQKSNIPLPPLRGDKGDIYILQKNNLFPLPIKSRDGFDDCYYGDIKSINWPLDSEILKKISAQENNFTKKSYFLFSNFLSAILPKKIKQALSRLLIKSGRILNGEETNNKINPKILK